ncbi:hypothetical protein SCANM63S_04460 [Streptomyces canarius]
MLGGGTWSTDYTTFWCCQGTGVEIHTRLMDSVYFRSGTTLTVNMFVPSVLTWTQRGITVTQTTSYPASDTTTLRVTGDVGGTWAMRILDCPGWTTGRASASTASCRTSPRPPGVTRPWSGPGPPATPSPYACPWSAHRAAAGQLQPERLHAVNPGPVDTGYATGEVHAAVAERSPAGRWGAPDDPARLIAWLATDEAGWITGEVVTSEGGFRH